MSRLLLFCLLLLIACQSPPSGEKVILRPPKKTGFRTWEISDKARQRMLHAQVWYPVSPESTSKAVTGSPFRRVEMAQNAPIENPSRQYPLILLSPDEANGPDSLAWLAEILVANDYVVAAVQHSDSDINYWNRPLDISALLTSVLSGELKASLDPERIGFVGYSSGALTGVWLADGVASEVELQGLLPQQHDANSETYGKLGEQLAQVNMAGWRGSYRDPRIKAFLLLAPSWAWIFQDRDLKKISSDMLIIAGDADDQVSVARNGVRYAQWIPQAEFRELRGHVGHWEFLGAWTPQAVEEEEAHAAKSELPTIPLEQRRRFVHEEVGLLTIDFFKHHLHQKN